MSIKTVKRLTVVIGLFIFIALPCAGEKPIHEGYPFAFDANGKITRISNTELVLGDTLYKFSSATTFHSYENTFMERSQFKIGDTAALILSNKDSRTIESMWLIKKAE